MSDYPHVPAAFINAIAEEGTKAEAVEWLQKTWNELCAVRAELRAAKAKIEGLLDQQYQDDLRAP